MTTSTDFRDHVLHLQNIAESGDEDAVRSLACLALLSIGWRPGDPDPEGPDDDGGCEIIDLSEWLLEIAA